MSHSQDIMKERYRDIVNNLHNEFVLIDSRVGIKRMVKVLHEGWVRVNSNHGLNVDTRLDA